MTIIAIEVISITVVHGSGPDHIYIETTLPEPTYPFKGNASIKITASQGNGEQYCVNHFPNIPIKSING